MSQAGGDCRRTSEKTERAGGANYREDAMNKTNGKSAGVRRARRGFTLIEAIVIVVILGVLASVIGLRLIGQVGKSEQAVAKSGAAQLVTAMQLFLADHGSSVRLDEIDIEALYTEPDGVTGDYEPYVSNPDQLNDPWGNRFVLVYPGEKNVHDFDIVSYGADGQPGGEGDNADIVMP
jgi:general secretion pathway protein G